MSITLWLGENLGWKRTKKGNTSLNLLSMSTNGPLTKLYWHLVRSLSENKCWLNNEHVLGSMREQMMWLKERKYAWSCDLSLSFWR